jgi:hypothetical protein
VGPDGVLEILPEDGGEAHSRGSVTGPFKLSQPAVTRPNYHAGPTPHDQ